MKILNKIKIPVLFIGFLLVCWYYGSAYLIKDISRIPPHKSFDILLIMVYFFVIIAVTLLAKTNLEKIIVLLFSIFMLYCNTISAVPIGDKNPLHLSFLELKAFLLSPNNHLVINNLDDISYFYILRDINLLFTLIPFAVFLFTSIYTLSITVGKQKLGKYKLLLFLASVTCVDLKLSTLGLEKMILGFISVITFICWIYTIFRYRVNHAVSRLFFIIYFSLTAFYVLQLLQYHILGVGSIGNKYIGIYSNEVVLGPFVLHYINLFPIFADYSINLPEFICIVIIFVCTAYTYLIKSIVGKRKF